MWHARETSLKVPMPMPGLPVLVAAVAVLFAADTRSACAQQETVFVVKNEATGQLMPFDRSSLEAMRQVTYRTTTIWTDGVREFRGVPLSEVLQDVGVSSGKVVFVATNDYSAEMPVEEVTADVPLLALTIDGHPMRLRDKGPVWVVFPYDLATDYQSEVVYSRSVWQMVRIEVLP
jgi:hypothetical protein